MKHVITSLSALLVGTPLCAATIEVGHHSFDLSADQHVVIPIMVSGDEMSRGMQLIAQVGRRGPDGEEAPFGPKFEPIPEPVPPNQFVFFLEDMVADSLWGARHDWGTTRPLPVEHGGRNVFSGALTTLLHPVPLGDGAGGEGILVNLLVDLGDRKGAFPLLLGDVEMALDEKTTIREDTMLVGATGSDTIATTIINGTIAITREPSTLMMLAGLLVALPVVAIWRRRLRRR